jgi:hypothetical protein
MAHEFLYTEARVYRVIYLSAMQCSGGEISGVFWGRPPLILLGAAQPGNAYACCCCCALHPAGVGGVWEKVKKL